MAIASHEGPNKSDAVNTTIMGVLSAADSTSEKVKILVDKKKIDVNVPDGLTDIVRKYFDENVVIDIRQEKDKNILLSIDLA